MSILLLSILSVPMKKFLNNLLFKIIAILIVVMFSNTHGLDRKMQNNTYITLQSYENVMKVQ